MTITKQVPPEEWKTYFDRFTRQFLAGVAPESALEIMSPTLGDQFDVTAMPLLGLTFDPKSRSLEVLLEKVDHLVFQPEQIWVVEDETGFISNLEILRSDGTKEIIYIRRSGRVGLSETDVHPTGE